MLLTVLALAVGLGALFYSYFGAARQTIAQNRVTTAALAQAKEALIGYAASDSNRPGSLPCPDLITNNIPLNNVPNDGSADSFSGSDCPSYIGRLPWRTLGLPDLRDGNGERLWYAVTREFARNPSCFSTCPMNSDTKGTLTTTGASPASDVIAIVFSPGTVVSAQVRDTANENAVANYLEGGNETGIGTSTFVTGAATASFNDRLLAISGADVMTPVEKRVAKSILTLFQTYRTAAGYYPWADNNFDGISNNSVRRGAPPLAGASPLNWGSSSPAIPVVPGWLTNNQWWRVIYYAISENAAASGGSDMLEVDSGNARLVLFTTGPAVTGDGRPSANPFPGYWCDYLENPVSGNNCNDNDTFWTPTSTAYARDRIYVIP